MTLSFAKVTLSDGTLLVRFSQEPYKHDLKILLMHWWLPMMIYSFLVVSVLFWFKTLVPAFQICAGLTFLCATVVYQIVRSSLHVAAYTFDCSRNEISRNGILVSRLSESDIILQTRLGWQGNRRFRLVLKRNGNFDIILAETPLLLPQNRMYQYYGQTHAENVRTMFCGWVDDAGRRDAVDERDLGIFALAKTLEEFTVERLVQQSIDVAARAVL